MSSNRPGCSGQSGQAWLSTKHAVPALRPNLQEGSQVAVQQQPCLLELCSQEDHKVSSMLEVRGVIHHYRSSPCPVLRAKEDHQGIPGNQGGRAQTKENEDRDQGARQARFRVGGTQHSEDRKTTVELYRRN